MRTALVLLELVGAALVIVVSVMVIRRQMRDRDRNGGSR